MNAEATVNGISDVFLGTNHRTLAARRFYEKAYFERIAQAETPPMAFTSNMEELFYRLRLHRTA